MSIQLHISPKTIHSFSSLYNDTNRIFMEYIDNALDSAETIFGRDEDSYLRPVEITFTIGNNYVSIEDNCLGVTDFNKLVQSIGWSDKKDNKWSNGQFGLGIYSFMAACGHLSIVSKLGDEIYARTIEIKRDQFNTQDIKDVTFPDPQNTDYRFPSGTKIVLSEFDKDMWKQINFDEIKGEIEKHFELLLARKNLQIKLFDELKSIEYLCKTFDYKQYEGKEYKDSIHELYFTKGRKIQNEVKLIIPKPIHVFLKVTKGRTINKPPVFIVKGRRIAEIKDIKQFHSKYKSEIWGHPNMTGYVDLGDYIEPTIARNDFKNTDKSKALFNTLEKFEPDILEVIRDVNKESEAQHYKNLEDKLSSALSKLAKMDALNFRTTPGSGDENYLQGGGGGQSFEEGFGEKDTGTGGKGNGGDGWGGVNDGDGIGPSGKPGEDTSGLEGEDTSFPGNKDAENQSEDTGFKGGERKKSGFGIKFVDGEIVDNETNKPKRSLLIGGTIHIFREHPDFKLRVDYSRTKEPRISQRLITYLAGEITVHYKDQLQVRHGQPEYNKKLFENLVEFIYQFEGMIEDLVGQNLSDFNK